MIQYDSIPHLSKCKLLNKPIYAFDKYDGSNLRFEWQPKKGFCKFGSRTQLINDKTEIFGPAITQFQDTIAGDILQRLQNEYPKKIFNTFERFVVFCEFFGPNSFAGNHDTLDTKELRLFDVHLFKKGFIAPKEFVRIFGSSAYSAELLYQGNLNQPYIVSIQQNTLLAEGVICKGVVDGRVEMVKVKTDAWLTKIKAKFDNWEDLI